MENEASLSPKETECASFEELIKLLEKNKSETAPGDNQQQQPWFLARRKIQINMNKLLKKCIENVDLLNEENLHYDKKWSERIVHTLDSAEQNVQHKWHTFVEPFIVKKTNNKTNIDSFDYLDHFRLETVLKGKKVPNLKKNHNAQFFQTRHEGYEYLERTKNFFSFFPKSLNLAEFSGVHDDPCICRRTVPPIADIIFILPCKSDLLEIKTSGGTITYKPTAATFSHLNYYDKTYKQVQHKKKIFKIPMQFLLHWSPHAPREIIFSQHSGIIWFNSQLMTISN